MTKIFRLLCHKKTIVISSLSFYFLKVSDAFAQTTGQINIVPPDIANMQGGADSGQRVAGWVSDFYQFSLIAGVFLAVGVIVWAGLRYTLAAGNPSTQSDARDQILQAILGLILLFGAFLVLSTINPNLVNLKLETLKSVSAPAPAVSGGGSGASGGWGTGSDVQGGGGTFGGGGASGCTNCLTNAEANQALRQNGVSVAQGISLEGLRQPTVDGVLNLKQNCGCDVTVTSGTGGVHQNGTYSHANGYKVDLRLDSGINNYIEKPGNFIGIRSDDGAPMYSGPGGGIYAKEGNHWDVVFRPS